ncbi:MULTISPECIES: hypothetical protein [Rhodobacterales]|uniref:hypothetical protein n=1 Tax=Roseobacter sp. N2S TaxID=2663844 RepID=UPI0028650DAC|nr:MULTISPECIES: hypothetical protein [Rhodobacterales]MDR6266363.1 putative PhzF superfamily epimerase YddE/YHI9 [Roseobacter sp. N2S]
MTFSFVLILLIAIVLVFLTRSKMRGDALLRDRRLDATDAQIQANTFETGHSHTYYITKDPEQYARIFVPTHARK